MTNANSQFRIEIDSNACAVMSGSRREKGPANARCLVLCYQNKFKVEFNKKDPKK
jgi:hypothetical protein